MSDTEQQKVDLHKFALSKIGACATYKKVESLADRLHGHLNTPEALARIAESNQPGNSSSEVQKTFLNFAQKLGFESEKQGLFKEYGLGLRPDYFLRIDSTGILLEVERGKTTINNMDLLDFWKCHLCAEANHLFLLVPHSLRQNETMSPRNEFVTVSNRLSKFFKAGNATNVHSLSLFGY